MRGRGPLSLLRGTCSVQCMCNTCNICIETYVKKRICKRVRNKCMYALVALTQPHTHTHTHTHTVLYVARRRYSATDVSAVSISFTQLRQFFSPFTALRRSGARPASKYSTAPSQSLASSAISPESKYDRISSLASSWTTLAARAVSSTSKFFAIAFFNLSASPGSTTVFSS
jgi:hypothetical protein